MENINVTRGELTLALMLFRALNPENQEAVLAIAKAMQRCQEATACSQALTQRKIE